VREGRNPAGFAPSATFRRTEPTHIWAEYSLLEPTQPFHLPSKQPRERVRSDPARSALQPNTRLEFHENLIRSKQVLTEGNPQFTCSGDWRLVETCREFGSALDPSTSTDFHSQFHEHATRQASRPAPTRPKPSETPQSPPSASGSPSYPRRPRRSQQHTTSTPSRASSAPLCRPPSLLPLQPNPKLLCSENPKLGKPLRKSQNPLLPPSHLQPNPAPTPPPPKSHHRLPPPPLLLREGRHPGGRPATLRKSHAPPNLFFPRPVAFAFGAGPNPVGRSPRRAGR